ncbi:MAG: UPF0175 family protein [Bacteroidota bacterium]
MKQVVINLPESIDLDEKEISMTLAAKLYEEGRLSLGQAAETAGMSKRAFAEILGSYGVSLFNYPASDLARDIGNA